MRDVLANMGEFSAEFGFDPMAANTFQILSIEPPDPPARRRADVIPLRRHEVA